MRFRHGITFIAVLLLLNPLSRFSVAEEVPLPRYSMKELEPRLGTNIRRNQVTGPRIAVNLPYALLPPESKQALHSWWETVPEGDEPPFPVDGLRALYDPLRKAHNALLDPGDLLAVATVGADGKVIEVKVLDAPNDKMANFSAQLLLRTAFKPAVCSGQACRMDFPLRMTLTVSAK